MFFSVLLLLFLGFFLSLLYIIGEWKFFLIVYLPWGCPFVFLYCIRILELPLEVWRVGIDLGLHSGKLFLPHLFICIMFLFLLGFLRFILFYIYYICEHFGSWIFYPIFYLELYQFNLFIYSLYYTFCMYIHLSKFFCSSICLSFLFIILLICIDIWYYMYYILFQVSYICVNFVLNFL